MDDEKIIELFFERSEQGIRELDQKYGKICHSLSYNIVNSRQDAEECVNDAYLGAWNAIPPAPSVAALYRENRSEPLPEMLLEKGGGQTERPLYGGSGGTGDLCCRPENRGGRDRDRRVDPGHRGLFGHADP